MKQIFKNLYLYYILIDMYVALQLKNTTGMYVCFCICVRV